MADRFGGAIRAPSAHLRVSERGQAVAEYALIAALVVVVAVAGFAVLGAALDVWAAAIQLQLAPPVPPA